MTYRTILLELTNEASLQARLQVGRSLASRFEATLVAMHVAPPPFAPTILNGGAGVFVPPTVIEAQDKAAQETRQRVRATFEEVCGSEPAMMWREAVNDPATALVQAARAADLVVASAEGTPDFVDDLVIAAGVPVLVLPANPPHELGRRALVAWDGSREATRALHDALPFLRHGASERTALCAVGESAAAGLDEAVTMLQRHGISASPVRVSGTNADAGEILLQEAAAQGADLLVMGAYGHSRLRELVFGGATRHALRNATVPVLFGS